MEVEEIVKNVFGRGSVNSQNVSPAKSKINHSGRMQQSLNEVENYVKAALGELDGAQNDEDNRPGRIGPKIVEFEVRASHGMVVDVDPPDRLSVSAWSHFGTIRANTALYSGKWMYELQLEFKGIMQIGWGTANCKFSEELGVGDTSTSYAYDGNRVRKWNGKAEEYGEPWLSGDIIGSSIDLNEGTITFYRNGRSMGQAFSNISMGKNIAYFPTVSLGHSESVKANFGATPFQYPIDDYEPIQKPPTDQLNKTALLLEWLKNLIQIEKKNRDEKKNREVEKKNREDEKKNRDEKKNLEDERKNSEEKNRQSIDKNQLENSMSIEAYICCLGRIIIKNLAPLLTIPYITEDLFVPFVRNLSQSSDERWQLLIALDMLWMFLDEDEMKIIFEKSILSLSRAFRRVSSMLDYPEQIDNILPLINLCYHTETRKNLLNNILFDRIRIADFLHIKPLDDEGFNKVVQHIWWQTNPIDTNIESSRKKYFDACDDIKKSISELEALQIQLLILLLDNDDGTILTPSSRTIFLRKFRKFVQLTFISVQIPFPVTVCCFHRLLAAFKILWKDSEEQVFIPCRLFYDGSINYNGIDRLGGVLSHLTKTYKTELIKNLGKNHEIITEMDKPQESENPNIVGTSIVHNNPSIARVMNRYTGTISRLYGRMGIAYYTQKDYRPMPLGAADDKKSLLELLDGIVLFYHAAVKKQISKIAGLRSSMDEYISAMSQTKMQLETIEKSSTTPDAQLIKNELNRTIEVLNKKLAEQARQMAWVRAVLYSGEKQSQIAWLLKVVTMTLKFASQEGNLFSFVPDFYLEALSDLSVGLHSHLHPTAPIENLPGYEKIFLDVGQFLCDHFLDSRIVHANSKDTLILLLASFVSNSMTLLALENVKHKSKIHFVRNLLRPYENRAWAQTNWVLVRFWQGHGFAFRYEKSPHLETKFGPKMLQQDSITQPIKPCPSTIFQDHVKEVLLGNIQATTQFLNSLLNQLNWAFSEFVGMVQEIHNGSLRPVRVFIESRQLKICATCFDLAVSLLRVIEMIAVLAPKIFNDPTESSSENLTVRLCQLLCQILNRVSSQTSSFQHVVLLDIADLETVDHFPILGAVVGILLALLRDEMCTDIETEGIPRTTRILLNEPSFQMSSLNFIVGEDKSKKPNLKNIKTFSLENYKFDVNHQELLNVREMIDYLKASRALLPEKKLTSDGDDDEGICTICYANPIDVTFKPCNHQSCRACIDRHVLNSKECFFCKAIIIELHDLEGILLDYLESKNLPPIPMDTS